MYSRERKEFNKKKRNKNEHYQEKGRQRGHRQERPGVRRGTDRGSPNLVERGGAVANGRWNRPKAEASEIHDGGSKTESDLVEGVLAITSTNSVTKLTLTTAETLTVLANEGVPELRPGNRQHRKQQRRDRDRYRIPPGRLRLIRHILAEINAMQANSTSSPALATAGLLLNFLLRRE